MKILTITVGIVIILAVAFVILGFLGPQGIKMERSVEIKAPRTQIYQNISDYTRWPKWSPWFELDTACKYEYFGTQGQVGAGYKWKGNSKAGEGSMETTAMEENNSLTSKLAFLKPFPSQSVASFKLEEGGEGAAKVTWGFSQQFSFMQRPFMFFMNLEKMLGPDYERGLANLKALCEKTGAAREEEDGLIVQEIQWMPHTYLADRSTVDMKDLSGVFMKKMPRVYTYLQKYKLQMDGPPSGLYFTWDTMAQKTDMAVTIPVKDGAAISGEYTAIKVGRARALMVDYYGAYDGLPLAHSAIQNYARQKGYSLLPPAIEEYVTDPGTEKNPDKVLTKVYYLIGG